MSELKNLGKQIDFNFDYYFVKLNCEEFTCVCPVTHQPDFATLKIRYIPDEKLVESKSLKLYLTSFRNVGTFHEDVVNRIADDLIKLLNPRYFEIEGLFKVRGGISIEPFVNFGRGEFEEMAKNRMAQHQ